MGLLKELGNMRGLDMNRAEPAIVNGTREVAPDLEPGVVVMAVRNLLELSGWRRQRIDIGHGLE